MTDPDARSQLRDAIRAQALALGFASCGFAPADAAPESADRLREWIDNGAHGEMGWMADRRDQRARPTTLWPDARSLIMLGMNYAPRPDRPHLGLCAGQRLS
jgi:epoxyqueuosine reductase